MSEKKIKVDKTFLLVVLALSVAISFISLDIAKEVVPGILIGFLGASILFSKDIKKFEADSQSLRGFTLGLKLGAYVVMFVIALRIGENTLYAAIMTLVIYRNAVISALKK